MRPVSRLSRAALALAWALSALLAACSGPASAPTPTGPVDALKLFVSQAGLVRLTRADLQKAGLSVEAAALPRLQLSLRGRPIPLDLQPNGDNFSFLFYAAPPGDEYSRSDVYWLEVGNQPGARMETRAVEPPDGDPPPASFPTVRRLEEDQLYFPNIATEAHWFWRSLTAPATDAVQVTLPGYAGGGGRVQIGLAGLTDGAHKVQVSVNDQPAGEADWQGGDSFVFEANTAALQPDDNTIGLSLPGGVGSVEVDLVDWVAVTYQRTYFAQDGALEFGGEARSFEVSGLPAEDVALYDITDPGAAQRLTGFQTARDGATTSLAFHDTEPGRRYLAIAPSAAHSPDAVEPVRPPALDLRAETAQADYLIIAPAEFAQALQPLVQHRAEAGLHVQVVDVETVYDAFCNGAPDPHALRDFLAYARDHWAKPAPRFVLLVGKASYDYRDNLNGPNKNLVPTYLVVTPHLGQAASDNWFVATSETDLTPTMAIGRLPAKTPTQVKAAVDKILKYEAGLAGEPAWRRRSVFVADNKDTIFDSSSDVMAQSLGPAVTAHKIYLSAYGGDVEATRAEIVRAWNDGALLMTYVGHGSIDTWAAGPLFGSQYVDQIKNGDRLPILLTPTCLDGFFYHPEKDSLAEELLFKADGGIVAGLVPTGLSLPGAQDKLMSTLLDELFVEPAPTLGEAILRARQKMTGESPAVREVLETFVLLGDPALKWQPPG